MKTDKKTILGIAAFLIVLVACASLVFLPKTALGEEPTDVEKSDSKVFYPTYVQEGYDSMIEWKKDVKDCSEATVTKGQSILDSYKDYFSDEQKSELQSLINKASISSCFARLNEYGTELDQWETKGQQAKEEAERVAAEKAAAKAKSVNTTATSSAKTSSGSSNYVSNGSGLTRSGGVNYHNGVKETYYNMNMSGVIANAKRMGISGDYWVRGDGVKMYGDYVIVASQQPKGTKVSTSLGNGLVLDYCPAGTQDIATSW